MSYIGNTPTNQNFVAGSDQFNGTGSQTVFTLSRNVNTVNDIQVVVSNVPQDPFTAYSVSGNSLTFTSAPPSGTGNIYVVYRATNVQTFVPTQGVSPSFGNLTYTGTLTGSTGVMNIGSGQVYKDASGNVGIGTSSPTEKLQVAGSIRVTSNAANFDVLGGQLDFATNTTRISAYNSTGGAISFFTNPNAGTVLERMRVDSGGRVTMPYQPCFSLDNLTNGGAINTPLIFTGVLVNRGSHYNTTTGKFTAPVAGVYQFIARFQVGFNGGYCYLYYHLNNVAVGYQGHTNMNGTTQWQDVSMVIQLTLAVGDTVDLRNTTGATSGATSTSGFCGFLIG